MVNLGDLHDAILEKVEISWEHGTIVFHIGSCLNGKCFNIKIIGKETTDLKLPRFFPWGSSVSINKAWEENSGEAIKLIIEMQSGDVLKVRLRNYGFEVSETPLEK